MRKTKGNNKLPPTFIDAIKVMSTEELRQQILKSTATIEETVSTRDADERYQTLKENYTTYASAYKETISTEKAKIAFLVNYLKEDRGQVVYVETPSSVKKGATATANGVA